jgi:bifunctional oligoribonuclease and PAP phosphatase NrnA
LLLGSAKENEQPAQESAFSRVLEVIQSSQSFVLTTHQSPDGDGLGAESALAAALAPMGKTVHVINNDSAPARYRFLPGSDSFIVFRPHEHQELLYTADAIILLDCARPERTGRPAKGISAAQATTVAIDHHLDSGWARVDLINPAVAATTMLVYELIHRLTVELTPEIAQALYTGIVSDTDCFRHPNTTPETHYVAARLLEAGASLETVHEAMFGSWSLERLKFQGHFLSTIRTAARGRLTWNVISLADLTEWGQTSADTEGLVEQELGLAGVKMAALFLEEPDNVVRLSLRSRGGVTVDGLARELGGGGHKRAAGARLPGPVDATVHNVLDRLIQTLEYQEASP